MEHQEIRKIMHEERRSIDLDLFTENIKKNINFSFTKYGDGEMICISKIGHPDNGGQNCDGHPYSEELGEMLKDSLLSNARRARVFLGDWTGWNGDTLSEYRDELLGGIVPNYVLYEILLNHENEPNESLLKLHEAIKYENRTKIFVGPERLNGVKQMLNCDTHIKVPLHNTFSEYNRILDECLKRVRPYNIFLFSCGMPSKVIIDELLKKEENLTCLDFGSGFDNILLDEETRQGQVDTTTMKKFYKKLLT